MQGQRRGQNRKFENRTGNSPLRLMRTSLPPGPINLHTSLWSEIAQMDLDLDVALSSCASPSLDNFDFDATLESSEHHTDELSPNRLSLIQRLEDATREGNLSAVKEALAELRYLVHEQSKIRIGRALLLAVEHQYQDIVAWLLSEDVETSYFEVKKATLMKNTAILQLLFNRAWDINKAFGWDDPPALAYAVEDASLAAWFLAHGADPNASCMMDKTPLSAAVQYAPLSVVQMLFANGGNVERGQLLHAAVWRKLDDRKTMVEYLLQKGALVNAVMYNDLPEIYQLREPFGLGTPLHAAAAIGDEEVLRLLIDHGAKLDIKDSRGFLAVDRAEAKGYSGAAQFLREQASSRP